MSRLKSLRFLRVDAVFTRFLYQPQKILDEDTLYALAKHGCLEQVQFGQSDVHELVQLAGKLGEDPRMKSMETKGCARRGREDILPWFGTYILREHQKGITELASALAAKMAHRYSDPQL